MANHQSALKRARQNEIRRLRNRAVKTRTRSVVKRVRQAAGDNDKDAALQELQAAQSIIDKAAKKGVIHKSTAARKISRLNKLVAKIEG